MVRTMTDDQVDDLKQFITITVRNEVRAVVDTEVRTIVREEIDGVLEEMRKEVTTLRQEMHTGFASLREEMYTGFASLRKEMNDGFAGVADILDIHLEDSDKQHSISRARLSNHEKRLKKLEARAA